MKPNSSLLAIHDLVNSWCRDLSLARAEKPTVEEITQAIGRIGTMCESSMESDRIRKRHGDEDAKKIDALKVALREMVR